MKTRIMACLLCVLMLVSMVPVSVSAAGADTWDGTADTTWYNDSDTEFTLTSAEQLAGLATLVNDGNSLDGKSIKLGADINLNKLNWTPIGSTAHYFEGGFDAQNHTISNMTINVNTPDTDQFVALFGGIKNAVIKNLTMRDVNITAVGKKVRAAAIVGIADSDKTTPSVVELYFENVKVESCSITAVGASGSALLGGVVGYCYPANMKNVSVSDLTINGKAANSEVRAAAILGYQCGQNISNNGNTRMAFTVDTFNVKNVSIDAEAYTVFTGGYAPYTYYGYITLKNGAIDGLKVNVDAHEAFVGGLVGYFWRSDAGHKVENVNITGIDFDVTTDYLGETRVGGMVGTSQSPNTKYSDCSVQGKIVERCSASEHPVNYHAKVGGFVARTYEWGLQTYTNCVADVDITGSNVAGGFVGNHTSTVSYVNCEAKGDVTANIAGGFAGRLTKSYVTSAVTFDECSASGAVTGEVVAGGFIGSTVNYGWNAWGSDSFRDPYAHNVTLTDCVASSTVTGEGLVAGIIGEAKLADGVDLMHDNVQFTVYPAYLPAETGKLLPSSIKPAEVDVTPTLSPADAAIEIKNLLGEVETANGGTYSLIEGMTYTYMVTKDDYITATGSFIAGEPLNVTLTAVHHCAPAAEWSFDENGHWHVCTGGCDELLDYASHEESDWIVDTDAEIGVEGVQHKECKVCGYKPMATEVIPAKEQPLNYVLFALAARYSQRFDVLVSAENATVTGDLVIKYKRTGTVEIDVADGYQLVDVIVNGQSLGAVETVTFKKVMTPQTLVVVTEPISAETPAVNP